MNPHLVISRPLVETTRARAHEVNCGPGVFFSDLLGLWSRFSIGQSPISWWTSTCRVDLGDGNQLKLVVVMVSVAAQRSDFVVGLMASAYRMLTASTKSTWVRLVEFLCRFCK